MTTHHNKVKKRTKRRRVQQTSGVQSKTYEDYRAPSSEKKSEIRGINQCAQARFEKN